MSWGNGRYASRHLCITHQAAAGWRLSLRWLYCLFIDFFYCHNLPSMYCNEYFPERRVFVKGVHLSLELWCSLYAYTPGVQTLWFAVTLMSIVYSQSNLTLFFFSPVQFKKILINEHTFWFFFFFSGMTPLEHNDKTRVEKQPPRLRNVACLMSHHPNPFQVTGKKQDCQENFQAPEIFLIFDFQFDLCLLSFAHRSTRYFLSN